MLGVVGLSSSMEVEWLKVDGLSGCAVLLSANHHVVAPSDWFTDWDWFEYAQSHIPIQVGFASGVVLGWVSVGLWGWHSDRCLASSVGCPLVVRVGVCRY